MKGLASVFDINVCFVNDFVWCFVAGGKRDALDGSFGKVAVVDFIPLILQDIFDNPDQEFRIPVVFAYLNDPIPMLNSTCHESNKKHIFNAYKEEIVNFLDSQIISPLYTTFTWWWWNMSAIDYTASLSGRQSSRTVTTKLSKKNKPQELDETTRLARDHRKFLFCDHGDFYASAGMFTFDICYFCFAGVVPPDYDARRARVVFDHGVYYHVNRVLVVDNDHSTSYMIA